MTSLECRGRTYAICIVILLAVAGVAKWIGAW